MKSNRAAVKREIDDALRKKNAAGAQIVVSNVREITPVGTPESTGIRGYMGGTLRNSVTWDSDETGFVVGTNLYYAAYVELGTRYMAARSYLRRGLVESIPELRRIYPEAA